MKSPVKKLFLFIFFIGITIVFCFGSPYPELMMLHHSATILAGLFLLYIMLRDNLSNTSFFMIILFTLLHVIGAKWTYLDVPYDAWYQWLSGSTLSDTFGWERNQYDRLVHFAYGFLIFFPAREIFQKWYKYSPKQALWSAFAFIASSSMFYELFEWVLSLLAPAAQAENYNGQQGDMWDAQKDMALASGAALFAIALRCFYKLFRR